MDKGMSAPVKLVGYLALLVIAFLVAYAVAGAVVPQGHDQPPMTATHTPEGER